METEYYMIPVTVLELLSQNDSEYELSSTYDGDFVVICKKSFNIMFFF